MLLSTERNYCRKFSLLKSRKTKQQQIKKQQKTKFDSEKEYFSPIFLLWISIRKDSVIRNALLLEERNVFNVRVQITLLHFHNETCGTKKEKQNRRQHKTCPAFSQTSSVVCSGVKWPCWSMILPQLNFTCKALFLIAECEPLVLWAGAAEKEFPVVITFPLYSKIFRC